MKKFTPTIAIGVITVLSYLLTKNPLTKTFSVQLLLFSILALVAYTFWMKKKVPKVTETNGFLYLATFSFLLLVGATGWFFSPFFFFLYLLAIFYAFVFSPVVSTTFVIILIVFFSFNIGEVDVTYDLLVVLSLLTTIPLSLYLRKEYLSLKQGSKEILVLEDELAAHKTKLEEVLANKMINFAMLIREPINDVKQLAYEIDDLKDKNKIKDYNDRIKKASEKGLTMLKEFEQGVTGKKHVSTPLK